MAAPCESPMSIFRRSVETIFEGWTALQLAVNQGYGGVHGREKALWLVDAVCNWFQENDGIQPEELEDFIAEIMDNEFETRAEDGSLIVISRSICSNFDLCKTGRQATVLQRIQAIPKASLGACQADNNQEMEDVEDDERPTSEHNMQAMMDSVTMGTSESTKPALNGYPETGEEPSSSTETNTAQMEEEDDGWTVVRNNKKK